MSSLGARATAVAGLVVGLLGSTPARAVGQVDTPGQAPETIEGLAADVAQGERAERRYAARTLRIWARQAVRQSLRDGDPVVQDEALLALQRMDDVVAPACIGALSQPEATVACADILGILITDEARPALQAALQAEERKRARRRLQAALDALDAGDGA